MFDVAEDLVELVADSPVICPHLHLPLQSGDDGVLAAMNRRYTASDVLSAVARLRQRIPGLAITTDVMAGFPGETEAAFENTLSVCRNVGFSKMHVFPYSVRPGTAAADLPDHLPSQVITERKKRLLVLADKLAVAFKQRFLADEVVVLVESCKGPTEGGAFRCEGLTPHYARVRFQSREDRFNRLVRVTIGRATPEMMFGEETATDGVGSDNPLA
jgi:threonylcarbamoyladenosine tRNA methylthiotransferase MtaB